MNTITTINTNTNNVMMSSVEIAHHTGKSHSHVLRDIKDMFKALEIDGPELDHTEYQQILDQRGYTKEIFLNYRFTECLVTGYSPKLRLAVLDALKAKIAQLEQQNTPKLPLTYLEALEQLVAKEKETLLLTQQVQEAQLQIEQQTPDVQFAQAIKASSTNLTMSEYAKVISKEVGFGRNTLYSFLREKKVFTSKNIPMQAYINKGYFVVVESIHNNVINLTVTITPLGQQRLLTFIQKHK
ncbi:hypothetical protein EKK58_09850 [Candidatus Dependentiae bacterium]|nr:MAG: hypothetical protein EKK58_09850 [Candidatus Dependentiae bacterium]